MLNRESWLWRLGAAGAVLAFMASHTSLIPEGYKVTVHDVSAVIGFICGLCGMSPMPYGGSPVK